MKHSDPRTVLDHAHLHRFTGWMRSVTAVNKGGWELHIDYKELAGSTTIGIS